MASHWNEATAGVPTNGQISTVGFMQLRHEPIASQLWFWDLQKVKQFPWNGELGSQTVDEVVRLLSQSTQGQFRIAADK